ncbi:reverse transcriptase domain-containing protein [Tanacetum coccineum]
MTEMFRLLKELTVNRTPEKVLIREEARHPVTKNVNSISLVRTGEEKSTKDELIKRAEEKLKKIDEEKSGETPNSQSVGYYLKHKINEKLVEGLIKNQSHSYIYPLGIAEDILVNVYPVDFMILDIKEEENRPFILGTPFLATAKAVIKFDKGTITLRSGKSKMSFHRILESLCRIEKGIKSDI